MRLLQEFKEFALRGNVVDLALGVVIGAAFGKIVSSLVADIITPPIGWISGGVDFTNLKWRLPAVITGQDAVTINYGHFLQTVFDFLIVAGVLFVVIKVMNRLARQRAQEAKSADTPAPSAQEALLTEIRDLLKDRQKLS
jgi:large conductance mechanosensitive channel